MAKYTFVSARQISCDANSATYECTVSAYSTSYFGLLSNSTCIAIRAWNGYLRYWGWPRTWKSRWGTPSYYLKNAQYYNGPFGNLQGLLGPDRSYTWTDTVPINRGNSRKGTLDVVVGLEYKGNDQRFGSALQTLRLETAEIPVANIQSFSGSADGGNVTGDRYIRLACKFTNPEGYYQCRLYDANGTNLKTVGGTSLEHNILITKDMYQTTRRFIVELYGRDNSRYDRREITVSIEPSGAGLWVKENSIAREVNKTTFRNVNHKEVKEVWIKKDGKWRKTRK